MMKRLGNIVESVANLGGYFSGWLVFLMMLLVAFEVFMRYVMHRPPMLADEFSAYMLVALSYIGMAYTWRQKQHVRISLLVSRLPPRVASWTRLITLLLVFVFLLGLDQAGYRLIVYSLKMHYRSDTWLATPLIGPHLTVFIGFILLTLLLIIEIARAIMKIRSGENVEEIAR